MSNDALIEQVKQALDTLKAAHAETQKAVEKFEQLKNQQAQERRTGEAEIQQIKSEGFAEIQALHQEMAKVQREYVGELEKLRQS